MTNLQVWTVCKHALRCGMKKAQQNDYIICSRSAAPSCRIPVQDIILYWYYRILSCTGIRLEAKTKQPRSLCSVFEREDVRDLYQIPLLLRFIFF